MIPSIRVTALRFGIVKTATSFGGQCDEKTSHAIMNAAAGQGITFLDTANVYPFGSVLKNKGRAEEIAGRSHTSALTAAPFGLDCTARPGRLLNHYVPLVIDPWGLAVRDSVETDLVAMRRRARTANSPAPWNPPTAAVA